MWRKSEDRNSRGALSSPDPAVQQPGIAVSSDSSTAIAMWGQFIKIQGEISGHGDFFLDGTFEGKVHIPDGAFTVGPNARVTGEIEAREIIVRGEVTGTLKAYERVQILSSGRVTGDMDTRGIVVEEGAALHGKVVIPLALLQSTTPETESAELVSLEVTTTGTQSLEVPSSEVLTEVQSKTSPETPSGALPETPTEGLPGSEEAPQPPSQEPSPLAKGAAG